MRHPARFLIGHFWNAPHAIPLVELVPGAKTLRRHLTDMEAYLKAIQMEPWSWSMLFRDSLVIACNLRLFVSR